uniref:Uncharacterized protein n=1 Tax=Rhizophagus irregularis (strain DAOM 181602 / DAOM 197198 / MUCL 43194) TaxID=747089 RepID=U9T0M8_RHIID
MEVNIFGVLNAAMKKYKFAKHSNFPNDTNIGPFKPDFTSQKIVVESFESFSKEDLESQSFSGPLHDVIEQVYNYMSALQLQYGILSTYDYHWFFYRPKNNNTALHISHPLKRDSTDPPVLKAYAYLAHFENIQIPRSMGSGSNVSSIFSGNQETRQQDNDEIMEQDFDFSANRRDVPM